MKKLKKCLATCTVYLACFQLAFAQSLASMPDAGLEAKRDFWSRLRFPSSSKVEVHITTLSAVEVTSELRAIMQELEENGGRGRYIRARDSLGGQIDEAIQILSPPLNPIYGSAFNDVFQELQVYGIPVLIHAFIGTPGILSLLMPTMGMVVVLNQFGPGAEAFFFMTAKNSNVVTRHELEHIRHRVTHYDEYLQALPEPPEWLVRLLEKREAGEFLSEREEKILYSADGVNHYLSEIKANEASLAAIFSKQGLREIADPKTWPREIYMTYNAILATSLYNAFLLYHLYKSDLSDSYSGELAAASKVVFYGLVGLGGIAFITFRLMNILKATPKAAVKAVRKGLGRCSLAARSLLRG